LTNKQDINILAASVAYLQRFLKLNSR